MLSRLYLMKYQRLTSSHSSLCLKPCISCMKLTFYVLYCSKNDTKKYPTAITNTRETTNSHITIAGKVKQTTKDAGYLGIIMAGIGVTGLMFYTIFRELFSKQSPNSIYSHALNLCRNDIGVCDALGEPIKGYGELSSRGRRRHVSHFKYEKGGKTFMRVKFYIEGIRNTGTVHLEMEQDEKSVYRYRYLFVDVDGYPPRTIILKDNRNISENNLLSI